MGKKQNTLPQVATSTATLLPYAVAPAPLGPGQDDTGNIQAAINATPNGGTLVFPTAPYRITSTLYIVGGCGRTFRSFGRPDSVVIGTRGAELVWGGPAGVDSMVFFGDRDSTINGIAFSPDGNATPPACALRIDSSKAPGLATGLPAPVTQTGAVVSYCLFSPPLGTPASFVHLDIGRWSSTNVDLGTVDHCLFVGGTKGIGAGGSSNLKGWSISRGTFQGNKTAIQFLAGSACVRDCTFTATGPFSPAVPAVPATPTTPAVPAIPASGGDIFFNSLNDFLLIEGANSESCSGLGLYVNGAGSVSASARNCRWSNMKGPAAVFARVGPALTLKDCYFQAQPTNLPGGGQGPSSVPIFLPSPSSAAGIVMDGVYSSWMPAGYATPQPAGIFNGLQQFGFIEIRGGSKGF